jgi:hypothetical protein
MIASVPSWFAADRLFQRSDGWYIGSTEGFRVGPYPIKSEAVRRSSELVAKLERCRSTSDQVRMVRAFLHEQRDQHKRQLQSGPSATSTAVDGSVGRPPVRAGEQPKVWFRTSRFFSVDDVWFFSTRENIDVGPYATREEAERDANRLLQILQNTATDTECRLAIMQFKTRPR